MAAPPASVEPQVVPDRAPVFELRRGRVGSVLRSADLVVPSGSVLGVLGPAGSGRSTLLAVAADVLRLDEGKAIRNGGAAYLPESAPLDRSLPVSGWLKMAESLPGWDPPFAQWLVESFALETRRRVGRLTDAQRVALGVVLTLGRRVPLHVMDEPYQALDPAAQAIVGQAIATRKAEGSAILVATDHFEALEATAPDHLVLLRRGAVLWARPIADWRNRFRVLRLHHSPSKYKGLPAPVLSERKVGGVTEAFFDDRDDMLDQWFGALGIQHEAAVVPLHHILTSVIQSCAQIL